MLAYLSPAPLDPKVDGFSSVCVMYVCIAANFHHLESFAGWNTMSIAFSPSLQDLTGADFIYLLAYCCTLFFLHCCATSLYDLKFLLHIC